jgi:hypothetical protein
MPLPEVPVKIHLAEEEACPEGTDIIPQSSSSSSSSSSCSCSDSLRAQWKSERSKRVLAGVCVARVIDDLQGALRCGKLRVAQCSLFVFQQM